MLSWPRSNWMIHTDNPNSEKKLTVHILMFRYAHKTNSLDLYAPSYWQSVQILSCFTFYAYANVVLSKLSVSTHIHHIKRQTCVSPTNASLCILKRHCILTFSYIWQTGTHYRGTHNLFLITSKESQPPKSTWSLMEKHFSPDGSRGRAHLALLYWPYNLYYVSNCNLTY